MCIYICFKILGFCCYDDLYPLEKGMATHSSIVVYGIPWTEELNGLHPGWKESDMTKQLTHTHYTYLYMFLDTHVQFSLDKHLEVKLLGCRVCSCSIYYMGSKIFSKRLPQFTFPSALSES